MSWVRSSDLHLGYWHGPARRGGSYINGGRLSVLCTAKVCEQVDLLPTIN